MRRLRTAHAATPQAHLLSNGRYAVMLTGAGSGYSRWGDLAVTRWREDATRDDWGSYVFLRDVQSGDVWSAGYQPSGAEPDGYEVDVQRGPRRVRPARRADHHDARGRRLAGGRRRSAPRLGRQRGRPRAGDRGHVLRRARARAARRRHGAPGFLQAVRADRVSRPGRRAPRDAAAALARRARDLGGASRRRRRRGGGRAGDRDRPGPVPRAAAATSGRRSR